MIWVSLALADPTADVLRQRQLVEEAAMAVASARASGGRQVLAERMAAYRTAAATLESLIALVTPTAEEERRRRQEAVSALTAALAEGGRAAESRELLVAWLGAPEAHVLLLEAAVSVGSSAPADIRRGLWLDVVEQADALAVLLDFDAAAAARSADELELRAAGLRRQAPGQSGALSSEVEAVRLESDAAEARSREATWRALRVRVAAVRTSALVALEAP